jgi:hypothetical protein
MIFLFWKEKWICPTLLRDMFPALYIKTMQPDCTVSSMGKWTNDFWSWELMWSAELSDMEAETAAELQSLLVQVRPQQDVVDRRRWKAHKMGFFSG